METRQGREAAFQAPEEKIIPERNRMGLVQALTILHRLRDICSGDNNDLAEALQVVFEWIDNMVLLLKKIGTWPDPPIRSEDEK